MIMKKAIVIYLCMALVFLTATQEFKCPEKENKCGWGSPYFCSIFPFLCNDGGWKWKIPDPEPERPRFRFATWGIGHALETETTTTTLEKRGYCRDGFCDAFGVKGEVETSATCSQDCRCGDEICDLCENEENCPADCGGGLSGHCGNGICERKYFEEEVCPADCGNKSKL